MPASADSSQKLNHDAIAMARFFSGLLVVLVGIAQPIVKGAASQTKLSRPENLPVAQQTWLCPKGSMTVEQKIAIESVRTLARTGKVP
jgi:hypothetical protein